MWTFHKDNEGWKLTDGDGQRLLLGKEDQMLGKIRKIIDTKKAGRIVRVSTVKLQYKDNNRKFVNILY